MNRFSFINDDTPDMKELHRDYLGSTADISKLSLVIIPIFLIDIFYPFAFETF